jgi:NTE family protein
MARKRAVGGSVGLVLAGGGARGAYEIGVLSILLPALEQRGQRPDVIIGTSVGALNASFVAAGAHLSAAEVVERGLQIWQGINFGEVLEPIVSPGSLGRLSQYFAQFLGVPRARLNALLDPTPLRETLLANIAFEQIERNVEDGALRAAAMVATSAATGRSVVFHCGANPPKHDLRRGIDYVETTLTDEHVRASAAIPAVFPAVHVSSPARARGWYFDGGTRLNAPIKPALELGVKRVVVIALNSIAPAPARLASEHQPDALEAAGQIAQALLVDPLVNDVQTLATVNGLVGETAAGKSSAIVVPYMLVAPDRDAIGRRAREVFNEHYADYSDALRARDVALLGRAVDGGSDALHGELLSYLFFAPQFAAALIELGRVDAQRWLDASHDDDIWDTGPPTP